jgi:hypothetical protein
MVNQKQREVTHQIHKPIGVLSIGSTGWRKEVNIVSWNNAAPKLDIREWSADHRKMSRGVGLNGEEVRNLTALLQDIDPVVLGI